MKRYCCLTATICTLNEYKNKLEKLNPYIRRILTYSYRFIFSITIKPTRNWSIKMIGKWKSMKTFTIILINWFSWINTFCTKTFCYFNIFTTTIFRAGCIKLLVCLIEALNSFTTENISSTTRVITLWDDYLNKQTQGNSPIFFERCVSWFFSE
jgi:hypothetical protein